MSLTCLVYALRPPRGPGHDCWLVAWFWRSIPAEHSSGNFVLLVVDLFVINTVFIWHFVYMYTFCYLSVHTIVVAVYLFDSHSVFWCICVMLVVWLCMSLHNWAVFFSLIVVYVFPTSTICVSCAFSNVNSWTFVACYLINNAIFATITWPK